MAVTPNSWVATQTPKAWTAAISNTDQNAWKVLKDSPSSNTGAGTNGSKYTQILITSTDTAAKTVQLARVRAVAVASGNVSSLGVLTVNAHGLTQGDQVFFYPGSAFANASILANTTYFVCNTGITSNVFQIATTAAGAAINTAAGSTNFTMYVCRPIAAANVALSAGTDGITPSVNMFNTTLFPGVSYDNDGNPYLLLESDEWLAVRATANVTAGNVIYAAAQGGNF